MSRVVSERSENANRAAISKIEILSSFFHKTKQKRANFVFIFCFDTIFLKIIKVSKFGFYITAKEAPLFPLIYYCIRLQILVFPSFAPTAA